MTNSSDSRAGIVEAIRTGRVFRPGRSLVPIAHDESFSAYDPKESPTPLPAVHASDIRDALLEVLADGQRNWDPRGLRVREATVIGTLDLNWLDLPFPLGFEGCEFDEWVWADHLRLPQLVFDSCRFASFGGTGLHVEGRLLFFGCVGVHQVFLPDARIGTLELRTESFDKPRDVRLVLQGAHIDEVSVDYVARLAGGAEQFASLHELLPGSAFEAVTLDRVVVSDVGDEDPSVSDWLRGGSVVSPAAYIAAWLGGEPLTDARRGSLAARSRRWMSGWLRGPRHGKHVDITWQRFADGLKAAGLEHQATELRIEAERHRLRVGRSRFRQLGATLLFDVPTRFGYRNARVGWLLGAMFVVAALIVHLNQQAFVPTSELAAPDDPYPGLWPLAYALDVVVSPVGTGQADGWWTQSSATVAAALIIIKLVSWLLGGLFVAGVSKSLTRS